MNNLLLLICVSAAFAGGFFVGDYRGAWHVQKQAVERKLGHWELDETNGFKSFSWNEVKP